MDEMDERLEHVLGGLEYSVCCVACGTLLEDPDVIPDHCPVCGNTLFLDNDDYYILSSDK